MKFIQIFSVFVLLNLAAWIGTHYYLSKNKAEILVVVDTSFALKPQFSAMEDWIKHLETNTRYKRITMGTDKALLGDLSTIKAKSSIFRTAFGRMSETDLGRYSNSTASQKILLSDGSIQPNGWKVVKFP